MSTRRSRFGFNYVDEDTDITHDIDTQAIMART